MKKTIFFILVGIILVSLIGIASAEVGRITAYVVADNPGKDKGNMVKSGINITTIYENNQTLNVAMMSNGKNALIKIMPETASATAIARLGIKVCNISNSCTIELKEVGNGNQTTSSYEVKAEKEVKLFGFLKTRMKVSAEVDSESGNVTKTKKPWWAFLASESTN